LEHGAYRDRTDDLLVAKKSASEMTRAVVNTAANAALPALPQASVVSRAAVGAGLGALNDPEQPIRGATAGALLNETLHDRQRSSGECA
jgi:hypothetical protein